MKITPVNTNIYENNRANSISFSGVFRKINVSTRYNDSLKMIWKISQYKYFPFNGESSEYIMNAINEHKMKNFRYLSQDFRQYVEVHDSEYLIQKPVHKNWVTEVFDLLGIRDEHL